MNRRLEERRADFQQYKRDVKERGKPFYPYAMFHDTVMSLLVVSLIVVLAVIWKFTAHEGTTDADSGWLGKLYDEKADPGTTNFVPRPDWYFYFLFYLLRIFKWPDTVILGTVIVPTILLMLLLALPFLDVRRERRPLRRPVAMVAAVLTIISMGTLTYKGATAKESVGAENKPSCPLGREGGVRERRGGHGRVLCSSPLPAVRTATRTLAPAAPSGRTYPPSGRNPTAGCRASPTYVSDPSKFGNNMMPKWVTSARTTCTSSAPSSKRPRARSNARFPGDHGRLGSAVRRAPCRLARRRPNARSACAPRRPASRCSRPSSTASLACRGTRCWRASRSGPAAP